MVDVLPGAAPGALVDGPAVFFDGKSATRRAVQLMLDAGLEISEGGARIALWPYGQIRRADGGAGVLRLLCLGAPELARLDVRDEALKRAIESRCNALGAPGPQAKGVRAIVFWSLAAALSIAIIAVYGVPRAATAITALIPHSLETRLGKTMAGQVAFAFGQKTCTQSAGLAAMDALADKLARQAALTRAIQVSVLDTSVANAFALPGEQVYVLRGLIDKAESVDELAGVLAHELGHVAHRDGLRETVASGGTAFLLGLLFGDVSGSGAVILAGRTLLTSAYSREAEAGADAFAATVMRGLGRSSAPLGEFLVRLTGEEQAGAIALLASHPLSKDRLAALKQDDAPAAGAPLLTQDEWKALKAICARDPEH